MSNPIIIQRGLRLGDLEAETDSDLLLSCFIDNGELNLLVDVDQPESIVIGRTGAGKSALLLALEGKAYRSKKLSPHDISIRFLEHSNIIQFFDELGVNLDLFYRLLWRHVLTIEFLKIRYDLKSETDSNSLWDKLTGLVERDDIKKEALSYFKEWGGKFWLETDQQVKEITEKLANDISAKFGTKIQGLDMSAEGAKSLSQEVKSEVVHRANKVVSEIQITKLSGVLDLLEEKVFVDTQKKYFILIDQLDEEWADTNTRYRFIRALIEEIKTFRKINNVKIIVSIRKDLIDVVFDKTRSAGFQQEKYESYLIPIVWSKASLETMLERRVSEVFHRKYTKDGVAFDDIFPSPRKGGGVRAVDYILDRTLLRPRDALQFVNECFIAAIDQPRVSWRAVTAGEINYSQKRFNSIIEEWGDLYSGISTTLEVLRGAPAVFTRSLINERLESVTGKLLEHLDDPCGAKSHEFWDSNASEFEVVTEILSCLFRVGAIGVKEAKNTPYIWSDYDNALLSKSSIKRVEQIKVHKMLHQALGISGFQAK